MSFIDKVLGTLAPQWAMRRAQARQLLAYYESARPSRTRTNPTDNSGINRQVAASAVVLRGQARHLDQNHDIAKGVLRELVNKTVGSKGIQVESLARTPDGKIATDFTKRLNDLWKAWCHQCDVTAEYSWSDAQRMMVRSKYRDGEVFERFLQGKVQGMNHAMQVPFTIQLIEADWVPFNDDASQNIYQGVQLTVWGKPKGYQVYRQNPNDIYIPKIDLLFANNIRHAKNVERIGQLRGISIFASVMNRLNDLKDYEDSERVAARISASMAAYVKKGTADFYDESRVDGEREIPIEDGMVFDGLLPGEDIGTIQANRPSTLLQPFRDSMVKAVSAGTGAGYSPISNDYNGTYSAQRQQLVDNWINYEVLQDEFIAEVVRPTFERFVKMSVASGAVSTRGLDVNTLYDADYRGPVMPWIDPKKEADAHAVKLASRLVSPQKVMRQMGENPHEVLNQIKQFIDELERLGLEPPEYLQSTQTTPSNP